MKVEEIIENPKPAKTNKPIHKLLVHRWSPRLFSDRKVARKDLETILEAARWAASSMNAQPWRFVYAYEGSEAYKKISGCLSEFNRKWVHHAPVLMVTAFKEQFDSGKENFHALHDLGLAVGNMSLQATSMGIALHSMAGLDWKKAQDIFDVPEGYHVATGIAIGYYDDDISELPEDLEEMEKKERKRKPRSAIASEDTWSFSE